MISAFTYCPRLVSFKAYIPGEKNTCRLGEMPFRLPNLSSL